MFRVAETVDQKQRLSGIIRQLSRREQVFVLHDGTRLRGRVVEEHHDSSLDDAGVWRTSAGITLELEGGARRQLDLLDVRDLHEPDLS